MARLLRPVGKQLVSYCDSTTLHGFKYITERGRHWTERILWMLCCGLSCYGAAVLIHEVWKKYSTSPTVTLVESTHYPIWQIPFPAITVCNINKVSLTAARLLYQQLNTSHSLSEDKYYSFMKTLAETVQPDSGSDISDEFTDVLKTSYNITVETLMKKLAQPCNTMMLYCRWRGEDTPCETLFTLEKTDAGYCCSFNYYSPENELIGSEFHVNGAGYLTGLTMLMDPRLDDYYSAFFSFYGLQVLVHSPYNYPDVTARGVIINPQREAFMQITAESTYSTEATRGLSADARGCLFEDENSPSRSMGGKHYSFRNCITQCKVRNIAHLCDCVPYYYPPLANTRTCGLMDVVCIGKYRRTLNNMKAPENLPGLNDSGRSIQCECLPTCSNVAYKIELSQGVLGNEDFGRAISFSHKVNITNHTILHVYYKELASIRFRRDIMFTWNDLLASFGGIVGLFLGCSILSMIEVVYYFTMRPSLKSQCRIHDVKKIKILSPKFQTNVLPFDWVL